jgi:hypothetical protein
MQFSMPSLMHRFRQSPRLRTSLVLLGVWLLAAAVRIIFVVQIAGDPVFDLLLGDAEAYDAWGRAIAGGNSATTSSGILYSLKSKVSMPYSDDRTIIN